MKNTLFAVFTILFSLSVILGTSFYPAYAEENIEEATISEAVPAEAASLEAVMEEMPVAEPAQEPVKEDPNKYQPKIAIGMLGQEFNIQVLYDHPMDRENNNLIEGVQMETTGGDFLGLATFGPNAQEAYAEFMVNPNLADFDEVVIIGRSTKLGEIRTPLKLELTDPPKLERAGRPKDKVRPMKKPEKQAGKQENKDQKEKKFWFF